MTLALSIVSHGHGAQVLPLLALLAQSPQGLVRRVWVTLNTPEPALEQALAAPGAAWSGCLDVRVLRNPRPLGFGANHNQAFGYEQQQSAPAPFFVFEHAWHCPTHGVLQQKPSAQLPLTHSFAAVHA